MLLEKLKTLGLVGLLIALANIGEFGQSASAQEQDLYLANTSSHVEEGEALYCLHEDRVAQLRRDGKLHIITAGEQTSTIVSQKGAIIQPADNRELAAFAYEAARAGNCVTAR